MLKRSSLLLLCLFLSTFGAARGKVEIILDHQTNAYDRDGFTQVSGHWRSSDYAYAPERRRHRIEYHDRGKRRSYGQHYRIYPNYDNYRHERRYQRSLRRSLQRGYRHQHQSHNHFPRYQRYHRHYRGCRH
jgi:hypothetical protein